MAQNEPEIPITDGDKIQAGNGEEQKPPENSNLDAKKDGGQLDKKAEESLAEYESRINNLLESWDKDRERFASESKRLREAANNPKLTEREEEELADIDDPDERAERKFEFKQKRKALAEKALKEEKLSEIRYNEIKDPEFAANKKDILAIADEYECKTLKQAKLIWRGLSVSKADKDKKYHDKRKKDADGGAGGNAGGTSAGKPYDKKTDGKKSFGDFYREGLK